MIKIFILFKWSKYVECLSGGTLGNVQYMYNKLLIKFRYIMFVSQTYFGNILLLIHQLFILSFCPHLVQAVLKQKFPMLS